MPEDTTRRRAPLGLAVGAVAALIFVGGTLLSLLSTSDGNEDEPRERPSVETLMADTDLVVDGEVRTVRRIGEPRDPSVIAFIVVEDVVTPPDADLEEILVFDEGFEETWSEGESVLLFLGAEEGLPQGAKLRVRERCVLEDDALACPYDLAEVERLGTR